MRIHFFTNLRNLHVLGTNTYNKRIIWNFSTQEFEIQTLYSDYLFTVFFFGFCLDLLETIASFYVRMNQCFSITAINYPFWIKGTNTSNFFIRMVSFCLTSLYCNNRSHYIDHVIGLKTDGIKEFCRLFQDM